MRELSPQFRALAEICASCGGPLPCALHDAALREAILRPPEEREVPPWHAIERTDVARLGDRIDMLAFLPDQSFLVRAHETLLVRCRPDAPLGEPGERFLERVEHGEEMSSLAVSPNGVCLIGDKSGQILQCDWRTRDIVPVASLQDFTYAETMTVLPDGTFLIGTNMGHIMRYDPSDPSEECLHEVVQHSGGIYGGPVPLPDGSYLMLDIDGVALHIDPAHPDRAERPILAKEEPVLNAIAPLRDGTVLLGGESGNIIRFDPASSRAEVLGNFGDVITSIVVLSDTAFAVAGGAGTIARYDIPKDFLAALQKRKERKLDAPAIPPMPEA